MISSELVPHCSRIKFQHQVQDQVPGVSTRLSKKMSTCYLDSDIFRFGCDTCFHSNFAECKFYCDDEKN